MNSLVGVGEVPGFYSVDSIKINQGDHILLKLKLCLFLKKKNYIHLGGEMAWWTRTLAVPV